VAIPIFQVLRSHLVSEKGVRVESFSSSALQHYVLLYWAEKVSIHGLIMKKVQTARMWTGAHERTVFPGVEEPCGTW